MRVTIEAIKRTDRVSKKGKPFVSIGLLTDKYPGKWLSGFGSVDNADWAKGMTVDIEVETKGEYLNFKPANGTPKKADMGPAANNAATAELKNMINLGVRPQLTELKAILFAIAAHLEVKIPDSRGYDYPEINETNNSNGLDFENDGPITRSDTPF